MQVSCGLATPERGPLANLMVVSSTKHVVVYDRDMSVLCQRCGERMRLDLPVNADVWVAAAMKFAEVHAACEPLVESSSACARRL